MQKQIRKAVIPAAGYGTRFLPVTKAIPKEMIPIVDKPVIQYIVEEALQSGIEEILIITGHGKRAIEDHFDTNIDLELAVDEAPSRLAALGRYILTPDIFEILRRVQPGKGGEIQLTDALRLMADREAVYAYTFSGRSYDTGNKLGFLKATVEYALRREDLGNAFREYLRTSLP